MPTLIYEYLQILTHISHIENFITNIYAINIFHSEIQALLGNPAIFLYIQRPVAFRPYLTIGLAFSYKTTIPYKK